MHFRTSAAIIAVGALCAIALSGCTAPAHATKPSHSTSAPSSTPSTTPTPSTTDVLFTVAANVRGSDGATIGIKLTAHSSVAVSDIAKSPKLEKTFLQACNTTGDGSPVTHDSLIANGSTLLPIDITSTDQNHEFVAPLQLFLGNPNFARTADGFGVATSDGSSNCFGSYAWARSGSGSAIAEFETNTASPDLTQWRTGLYGFAVFTGSNSTLEACTITVTPLGEKADLSGWNSTDTTGTSCVVGYSGE